MSIAKLRVTHAGPLVSLQDVGRFGHLRYGVSASGPMDRLAFAAAHAALGQAPGGAIEVSLGGLAIEVLEGAVTIAVAGGAFSSTLGAVKSDGWHVASIEAGQSLTMRGGAWGSWCYLAFAGDLIAQSWLGSIATHSMTGFGGGALKAGQILTIENAETRPSRDGPLPLPELARPSAEIRVVIGPQDRHFAPASLEAFLEQPFTISEAYDRMGLRLKGPALAVAGALSIPSEPILRGAVQVSGDGVATVLLADHGTTGGYPKIATVVAEDQDRLVQQRAGQSLRFTAATPGDAVAQARREAVARQDYLDLLAKPRASLAERLMQENLIGGVIAGDD
jgi:allophanate hydrolase